jgi:hypothetical protein
MEDVEFPGPILVFDKRRLNEAYIELFENDYYPISLIEDEDNEQLKRFREDFPEHNIDCIIVPVRYLTKFLA